MSDATPPEGIELELERLLNSRRHEWPDDAYRIVVAGLRSGDRQTRSLALRLAPRDVYDGVAVELLQLLDDGADDDAERLAVVDAMSGMVMRGAAFEFDVPCNPGAASRDRFDQLLRRLRRLFHDPRASRPLRLRALDAGARGGLAWAGGAARVAWRTEDPAWRRAAAGAFAWLGGFDAEIGEAVSDLDPVVRILGWRAAAEREVVGLAALSLDRALDLSLQGEERAAALLAVGWLAPAGAAAALTEAARSCEDQALSAALADTLAQLELACD